MERRSSKPAINRTLVVAVFTLGLALRAAAQDAHPAGVRLKRTVLVSIPDRKLAVMENDTVIATFPVAIGAASTPSPTGEFKVINRVSSPTYYHSGKVIPTGKDNPLGTRWLGLSEKGYGIHGTNTPQSVGHAASHGCIRLRNRDVEKLFTMLRMGDFVEIRGERDDETAEIFGGAAPNSVVAAAQASVVAGGQ